MVRASDTYRRINPAYLACCVIYGVRHKELQSLDKNGVCLVKILSLSIVHA
jgi:hypothetical protein